MLGQELAAGDQRRVELESTPGDPAQTLQEARQYSWPIVMLMIDKLRKSDFDQFPGTHAWLKDFEAATQGKSPSEHPIDIDQLVTTNANFWRSNFEVQPGDIGWAIIHAGLLQSTGEIQRSYQRLVVAKQFPCDETMMKVINSMNAHNQRVLTSFGVETNKGIKLHDEKKYAAAATKYRGILDVWPQYAWCLYELSLSQHAAETVARGNEPLPLNTVLIDPAAVAKDKRDNPLSEEVKRYRIRARSHDPLAWQNLSGMPNGKSKVAAIVRVALPAFKEMEKSKAAGASDQSLIRFAAACQMIEAHELVMTTLGVVVGRRGKYRSDDEAFIAKSLRALVPGEATEATLKRIGSGKDEAFIAIISAE